MRRNWSLLAVPLLVLALGGNVAADDASKARKHFKAGKVAYAAGDFRRAIDEFSAGYLLDPKPAFLINIAQSHRKTGDLKRAAEFYREFLVAEPGSPLKAQVRGLIREIEAEMDQKLPERRPPPEQRSEPEKKPRLLTVAHAPGPPRPAKRPASKPFYKRWGFWAGVAAVVGTGVGVGVYAGTREPDYVKEGGLGSVSW